MKENKANYLLKHNKLINNVILLVYRNMSFLEVVWVVFIMIIYIL